MLRKIRILIAVVFFILLTLLFLDFTGTLHGWFGWLARIQFVPALLAMNIGIVVALIIATLLLGRIYCSVICPLGMFQDVISRTASKRKKNRFSYSPAKKWLRYGVLAIFVIVFIASVHLIVRANFIVSLLEPYSAYGRIVSNLFAPIYQGINNVFAYFAESIDSYAFYSVDVWLKSLTTFVVAVVTLVLLFVLAWRNGRTYCNTICPVGTVLGFVSRFSIFKIHIDKDKCVDCNLCERNCKASCISKEHTVDYSRCVSCMNCVETCKKGAVQYKIRFKGANKTEAATNSVTDNSRRQFLAMTAAFAATSALKAQEKSIDGGYAIIEDKKVPKRQTPIKPSGSQSLKHFTQHCTACQLCVSVCRNQVLRPSDKLETLMQPEMSFERGYCRPECTKCSEVCPAGAIHRITAAEKTAVQIGHAVWIKENCVINTDEVTCTNCQRHCPTGAILLVNTNKDNPDAIPVPVIDTERCIGCGACEYVCPARPFSAMYVEGNENHRKV